MSIQNYSTKIESFKKLLRSELANPDINRSKTLYNLKNAILSYFRDSVKPLDNSELLELLKEDKGTIRFYTPEMLDYYRAQLIRNPEATQRAGKKKLSRRVPVVDLYLECLMIEGFGKEAEERGLVEKTAFIGNDKVHYTTNIHIKNEFIGPLDDAEIEAEYKLLRGEILNDLNGNELRSLIGKSEQEILEFLKGKVTEQRRQLYEKVHKNPRLGREEEVQRKEIEFLTYLEVLNQVEKRGLI